MQEQKKVQKKYLILEKKRKLLACHAMTVPRIFRNFYYFGRRMTSWQIFLVDKPGRLQSPRCLSTRLPFFSRQWRGRLTVNSSFFRTKQIVYKKCNPSASLAKFKNLQSQSSKSSTFLSSRSLLRIIYEHNILQSIIVYSLFNQRLILLDRFSYQCLLTRLQYYILYSSLLPISSSSVLLTIATSNR